MDTGSLIVALATASAVVVCAMALTARHPQAASLALIPIVTWPAPIEVAGLPVAFAVVALVFVGVMISPATHAAPRMLLALSAIFALAVAVSVLGHGAPQSVLVSEARNRAIALVLAAALVPLYAKAAPSIDHVMGWLGVSLSAACAYLAVTSSVTGGRLVGETTNSNSAGYAAAAGIIACALTAKSSRRWLRWVLIATPALYVLYAAQSRGAFTALLVGIIAATVIGMDGPRRVVAVTFGIAAGVVLWGPFATFAGDVLLSERSQQFVESDSRRLVLELAWEAFIDHPLGIGYGHFLDVSRPYVGVPLNTHNDWVRLFVEGGVVLGLCAIILVPGRLLIRRIASDAVRVKVLLGAGSVTFLLSNTMTDLRVSAPTFISAGVLWAAGRSMAVDGERSRLSPQRSLGFEEVGAEYVTRGLLRSAAGDPSGQRVDAPEPAGRSL